MLLHPGCPISGPVAATIRLVWFLFGEDQATCRPQGQREEPEASGRLSGHLEIEILSTANPRSAFFDLGLGSSSCHTQQLGGHTPLGDAGSMGTTFPGASAHRSPVPVANVR